MSFLLAVGLVIIVLFGLFLTLGVIASAWADQDRIDPNEESPAEALERRWAERDIWYHEERRKFDEGKRTTKPEWEDWWDRPDTFR